MRSSTLIGVLAVAVIVPVVIFVVWTALSDVTYMLNPCISWGMGNVGSVTVSPPSGGPCAMGAGGTSETISQAAIMLALIQGESCSVLFWGRSESSEPIQSLLLLEQLSLWSNQSRSSLMDCSYLQFSPLVSFCGLHDKRKFR